MVTESYRPQFVRGTLAITFSLKKCFEYKFDCKLLLKTSHVPLKKNFQPSKNISVYTTAKLQVYYILWDIILSSYRAYYEIPYKKWSILSYNIVLSRRK